MYREMEHTNVHYYYLCWCCRFVMGHIAIDVCWCRSVMGHISTDVVDVVPWWGTSLQMLLMSFRDGAHRYRCCWCRSVMGHITTDLFWCRCRVIGHSAIDIVDVVSWWGTSLQSENEINVPLALSAFRDTGSWLGSWHRHRWCDNDATMGIMLTMMKISIMLTRMLSAWDLFSCTVQL